MKPSNILWTNYSINFWSGCKKVSPGCANCYAEAFSKRNPKTFGQWGAGAPRNWHGPNARTTLLSLNKAAEKLGTRYKIFPNSMSDWLDNEVPIEWLAHMLETIYMTPNLDYQLVTKRPENWERRVKQAKTYLRDNNHNGNQTRTEAWSTLSTWSRGEPPHNIWIGITVEDQKRADERIPILLKIPACIRFLSCEPLLGPVELWLTDEADWACDQCGSLNVETDIHTDNGKWWKCNECNAEEFGEPFWQSKIHWVICGGESGSKAKARPMEIEWARSLRDQCIAASVPFFFKQWGNWQPDDDHWDGGFIYKRNANYRWLDGKEWSEMPS